MISYSLTIYLAGLLSFFSPCVFPIIPIYFGILENSSEVKTILNTIVFIFGLSITFITLAFAFSFIGDILTNEYIKYIASVIIIFFGLFQLGIFNIKKMQKTKIIDINIKNEYSKTLQSFIIGFSFGLGWTPCVGPILGSVLVTASTSTSHLYSIYIMSFYILGLATPFLIFSFSTKYFISKTRFFNKHLNKIKKISGILIIIIGILILFDKLHF